ncbi:sugar phosphate isomerase/epimerase family protein [Plastorhodobacter daqingensis]|uniref:Sugar phosphate isomerase/epimerase family protein n=1 Tax=Plastorhodobacter daqingensis TaxID=1387281 RepID=A0ABW2UI21_9RHOB
MTQFSYQLYSSRNFPPLEDTLRMLRDLGYVAVEGYGALYADPEMVTRLADALQDTGLAMPTAHMALSMLEEEPDRVIAIAARLGLKKIYIPFLGPEERPHDPTGWRNFGARLQAAGAPLRAAGIGFGWHNHDFEFRPLACGTIPQEAIFEGGPDLEWEADLAWILRGGADPLEWIARHGARITAVHIKDIAPEGTTAEDGWADPGHGTMDWPALMTALRGTNCTYFIMEHDNPDDHHRFASRAIAAF